MDGFSDDVLKRVVAEDFKVDPQDVTIKTKEIEVGSKAGDGFLSDIKRLILNVNIKDEEKTNLTYIAKCIPKDDVRGEMYQKVIFIEHYY